MREEEGMSPCINYELINGMSRFEEIVWTVFTNDVVKCGSLVDIYDFMRCSQAIL